MPSDDEMQLCAELDLLYWKRWRIEQDIQLIEQKLISPEDTMMPTTQPLFNQK